MNHRTHYEPISNTRRSMRRYEAVVAALRTGALGLAAMVALYFALIVVMSV